MKYFYEHNNGWQSTENWFVFRCNCSLAGTKTWCIDDCPQDEKHTIPEDCTKHITRYGIKEVCAFVKTPKGKKIAIFGSLLTVAITITIKIIININQWFVLV